MAVTVTLVSPGPIRFTYMFRDCVYLVFVLTRCVWFFCALAFLFFASLSDSCRTFGGNFFGFSNKNFSRDLLYGMPLETRKWQKRSISFSFSLH